MIKTAHDFYAEAIALRSRAIAGQTNETPILAWAAVCRACAKANNAKRNELAKFDYYTRLELNFFNNLNRIWFDARAQVESRRR